MSVVIDAVNSFFGHSTSHSSYAYHSDAPQTHDTTAQTRGRTPPRSDTPMSASQQRAPSSSAANKEQHASSTQQTPARPASPPLAARSAPPSESLQATGDAKTPPASAADTQQARPAKIKVKDLEHIRSFASEDMGAFSEIGNQSRSRSRSRAGDESPQYEISEMKVEHIIEMVAGLLTKITTTNDQQHEHLHRQPPQLDSSASMNSQTNSVLAFHGKNIPSISILSYLSRINKYCPTSYEVFLSLLVYFDRMTERVNAGPMQSLRQANEAAAMEQNRSPGSSSESLASDRMEGVMSSTAQGGQQVTPPASGSMEKAVEQGRPSTPHSRQTQPDSPPVPAEMGAIDPYNLAHFFVVDSFNIHRLVIAGVTCASKFFSDIFYTNSRYAKVSFGLEVAHRLKANWSSLGRRPASPRAQPPRASIPPLERLPPLRARGRDRGLWHHAGRVLRPRSGCAAKGGASHCNAGALVERELHR